MTVEEAETWMAELPVFALDLWCVKPDLIKLFGERPCGSVCTSITTEDTSMDTESLEQMWEASHCQLEIGVDLCAAEFRVEELDYVWQVECGRAAAQEPREWDHSADNLLDAKLSSDGLSHAAAGFCQHGCEAEVAVGKTDVQPTGTQDGAAKTAEDTEGVATTIEDPCNGLPGLIDQEDMWVEFKTLPKLLQDTVRWQVCKNVRVDSFVESEDDMSKLEALHATALEHARKWDKQTKPGDTLAKDRAKQR